MNNITYKRFDHLVKIINSNGKVRIRVLDESCDGGFIDTERPIRERDGGIVYNLPLEGGFVTPCNFEEASFIQGLTGQDVERVDWDRTDTRFPHHFLIPASVIPKDEKLRNHLFWCDPSSGGACCTGNLDLDAVADRVRQAQAQKTMPLLGV